MKAVYVAHPLRDNVTENVKKVTKICQGITEKGGVIPLSPIHAFGFMDPEGEQTFVFNCCLRLLSMVDELWVFGDWRLSEGCRIEVDFARRLGIPVVFMDEQAG